MNRNKTMISYLFLGGSLSGVEEILPLGLAVKQRYLLNFMSIEIWGGRGGGRKVGESKNW